MRLSHMQEHNGIKCSKQKKIAIIGSGRMASIVSSNARAIGIETHCFSNIEPDYLKDKVDVFHNISIFETDAIVSICKSLDIDGVLATTELTISIASYIAAELGTPGIPYRNAIHLSDKIRNRLACQNIPELHQPKFFRVSEEKDLSTIICNFPVIVKPTRKGGKLGVTVVDCVDSIMEAYKYAKKYSGDAPVIIEEFIAGGKEYSVESLTYNGKHHIIQITEKISSGPSHCVELGHHQPAAISNIMRKNVEIAISKGLTAIGLDNSICHTEIKIVQDKIYLIEFNARPGGDYISWPLTELSTGYNIIKGAIRIAIGEDPEIDFSKFTNNYAGVYFVTKQTECLKPIFDVCEKSDWFYSKNYISDELELLEHNDCYETNSIMYYSKTNRPELLKIENGEISLNKDVV